VLLVNKAWRGLRRPWQEVQRGAWRREDAGLQAVNWQYGPAGPVAGFAHVQNKRTNACL